MLRKLSKLGNLVWFSLEALAVAALIGVMLAAYAVLVVWILVASVFQSLSSRAMRAVRGVG